MQPVQVTHKGECFTVNSPVQLEHLYQKPMQQSTTITMQM